MTDTNTPNMALHTAWEQNDHTELSDWSRYVPSIILHRRYELFNEVRLLREVLVTNHPMTLLEVGCATGEFFRYISRRFPNVTYTGCDISRSAIARAEEKFGNRARFLVTDAALTALDGTKVDIVFSKDVVHHQWDHWRFLERLYGLAATAVVVRIRTRDRGPTESDPGRSCQFLYGHWVPYIVMNCGELLDTVRSYKPAPARVKLLKHPVLLGGFGGRYLPKSCYEPTTGTAASAMLLVKGSGEERETVVGVDVRPDTEGRPDWERVRRACALGARLIRGLVGRNYRGRTWW